LAIYIQLFTKSLKLALKFEFRAQKIVMAIKWLYFGLKMAIFCQRRLATLRVGSKPIINLQPALGTVCSRSGRLAVQFANALA